MGQRLTPEAAHAESIRLLGIALTILDDARSHLAAAYVAQAIHSLTQLETHAAVFETDEDFALCAPM